MTPRLSQDGHPLRFVRNSFNVDEKIYPILEWLWSHYFKTEYSCQGGLRPNEGDFEQAYILFYKGKDAAWFYKFLSNKGFDAEFSRREYSHGGGAAVRFNHNDIDTIIRELESLSATFDYMKEVIEC